MTTQQAAAPNLPYVDRPEISEAYADSLEKLVLDGPIVRLEFVVRRFESPAPPQALTATKYTSARLVLPITVLPALVGQLNSMMQQLVQQGAIKVTPVHEAPQGRPN